MPAPYCLPVIQQSSDQVTQMINLNLADYQLFEVWLDYIAHLEEAFVRQLVERFGDRLIFIFRRQNLEPVTMSPEQRQSILNMLSNSPCLVDLDIETQPTELEYIRQHQLNIKLLASYHNYQQTPDSVRLTEIIDTMKAHQPVIYKLATLCTTPQDSLRLMQLLLQLKADNLNVIVSGMGPHGQMTRVYGGLWGNVMTFAPRKTDQQSAPAQLTHDQLEIIYKQLES